MNRRLFSLSAPVAAITLALVGTSTFSQTKWGLPAGYAATNLHSVNLMDFANHVD